MFIRRFIRLLHVDPGNKHDMRVLKENRNMFIGMNRGCTTILDKGYVDEEFAMDMESENIRYIAIKRRNMMKDKREKKYYKNLARARKIIETRFSRLEEYGLRFIRLVSRRGLAVKILLSILAFNICQMMKFDGN